MPGGGSCRLPTTDHSHIDTFALGTFSIDEYNPIKVIVIGAGFGGILAGIRFPQKIPNVDLTIYEKSAGVGGTWYNNRYPGVACDTPAHCYQFSFEDKRDWSSFYAPGREIQQHLQDVVDKYQLMRYIKLKHEVVHARYDEPTGKWHIRIRHQREETGTLEEFEDVADVLLTAFGALSRWNWPAIDGLKEFQGQLHHTAGFNPVEETWEETALAEGWKDKKVGVIGVGSTAIQVVSAIQSKVGKLVNYVRGQTWLSHPFAIQAVAEQLGRHSDTGSLEDELILTAEESAKFHTDGEYFRKFRHMIENTMNSLSQYTLRGSPLSLEFEDTAREYMQQKLAEKPLIAEKLIPGFPVSCRRLSPGPGYLDALCADNGSGFPMADYVDFVTSPIKRFTKRGIETEDGHFQALDIVFCATGYDTSWQLPFKIIGRNGVDLNKKWQPHPVSYLSICVDGFPNMFMPLGPNSLIGAGALLPILESGVMYAVQATAKMQRERLKSMEVNPAAVKDFDRYIENYFPKTVFSAECRSWYKMDKDNGRIVGLWPGSSLHAVKALQHPRWEDYSYEQADAVGGRLYWFGDGQTWNEKTLSGDLAWYLNEQFLDRPPIPT